MTLESLLEVRSCRRVFTEIRENGSHSLMSLGVIGIELQGHLIMVTRLLVLRRTKQQIGQIHMSDGIVRMMDNRFGIHTACRRDGSRSCQQRTKLIERAEMRRELFEY